MIFEICSWALISRPSRQGILAISGQQHANVESHRNPIRSGFNGVIEFRTSVAPGASQGTDAQSCTEGYDATILWLCRWGELPRCLVVS